MLQTAKLFARRGSSIDPGSKRANGLTFGEFCVLAADLKRFRTQNHPAARCHENGIGNSGSSLPTATPSSSPASVNNINTTVPVLPNISSDNKGTISRSSNATAASDHQHDMAATAAAAAPEVFLGGSCNPTTWRADVAIPALDKLGISFYNPVSSLCKFYFLFIFIFVSHI